MVEPHLREDEDNIWQVPNGLTQLIYPGESGEGDGGDKGLVLDQRVPLGRKHGEEEVAG